MGDAPSHAGETPRVRLDVPPWAPFRKKPVEIVAYQFRETMLHAHLFDDEPLPPGVLFGGATYHKGWREVSSWKVCVLTIHEQRVYLEDGDWIVPEPKPGRFYPIKPEVFAQTYESLEWDGSTQQNHPTQPETEG